MESLYQEIIQNLELQLPKDEVEQLKAKQLHLGIFTEPYLSYMLEGRKTIESRFSKNKIAPFGRICSNDLVFIKKSSGNVIGYFTIKEVLSFDLKITPIEKIRKQYETFLCVDESFWRRKENSQFATLLVIEKVVPLKPFSVHKKGMQTWIIL